MHNTLTGNKYDLRFSWLTHGERERGTLTRPWLRQISNDCSKKKPFSTIRWRQCVQGKMTRMRAKLLGLSVHKKPFGWLLSPGIIFHWIEFSLESCKIPFIHSLLPMPENSHPISCGNKCSFNTSRMPLSLHITTWENVNSHRYNLQDLFVFAETHQLLL